MPEYHRTTPYEWPYEEATAGLAERLQAYMDKAAEHPAGSDARQAIRGTAQNVYENWRRFSLEAGKLRPEDDTRFLAILAQWL
jgi:hypothetical protein